MATRWRNAHKKAKRKSQGRSFPAADLNRFVLANKFAASKHCERSWSASWYLLKDGILSIYGRTRGLALRRQQDVADPPPSAVQQCER